MSGIFNSFLFNNTIFNTGASIVVDEVIKTGTGGIDPKRKRRTIYKPTGLLARKEEGRVGVEQRVEETREIHQEIKDEIALSFHEEIPISAMTLAEIDKEIGILLRKKIDAEDEEMMMLMIAIND